MLLEVEAETGTARLLQAATFEDLGVKEVADLQKWLLANSQVLGESLFILHPEFQSLQGSKDRIDILALDRKGHVVVIELKRDEHAAYADLQSLRYAAMARAMNFDDAVRIHHQWQSRQSDKASVEDSRTELMDFLGWEGDEELADQPRVILVSRGFSDELLNAVLFLREHRIDYTCIALTPYSTGSQYVIVPERVIPLKAEEEYRRGIELKEERQKRSSPYDVWNGKDFYVNFQDDEYRNWDDCRTYGFVAAGGGEKWSGQLDRLITGARINVRIPGKGYAGVGHVTGPRVPAADYDVEVKGTPMKLTDAPLKAPKNMVRPPGEEEYVVPVEWVKTVDQEDAFNRKGLFGNQAIACRLRDRETIDAVHNCFGIS